MGAEPHGSAPTFYLYLLVPIPRPTLTCGILIYPIKYFLFTSCLWVIDKIRQNHSNHSFPSPDAWEKVEYLHVFIIYLQVSKLLCSASPTVRANPWEQKAAIFDDVFFKYNMSSDVPRCYPAHPGPQWPGKRRDTCLLVEYTLNTNFPHVKPPANAPNWRQTLNMKWAVIVNIFYL